MMIRHTHGEGCSCLARRGLFGLAALAATGGVLATRAASAQSLTRAQRDAMTPDQVIAMMRDGNARFRAGTPKQRDWLGQQRASAGGQYPAAVLLSCIDSRAPAEVILDLRIGDVFNSRIAGNVHDVAVLGGMEFACRLAGAKVVLVMGHTACGAVAGAIAGAELGNLTALLAKIRPAIAATSFSGERSPGNAAFVDAVARQSVLMTVDAIRRDSPVLAEMERKGEIRILGSMYDLASGEVTFLG